MNFWQIHNFLFLRGNRSCPWLDKEIGYGSFCRISQLFRTQFNQVLLLWGGVILFGKKSKSTRGQSVTYKLEIIRRYNIRAPPARVHPTFSDTSTDLDSDTSNYVYAYVVTIFSCLFSKQEGSA